jgi:predicted nucleic acid-binding protein
MQAVYLDTSAAVKLFKQEEGSDALLQWLSTRHAATALLVTCDLTRAELRRALHASDAGPDVLADASDWLSRAAVLRLTPDLLDRAGDHARGTTLRTLDAVHVVAAMALGPVLEAFVAYDKRLCDAAAAASLNPVSPM